MLEVLNTEPAIRDEVRLKPDTTRDSQAPPGVVSGFSQTTSIRGEIEFRDLVFRYGDGNPVLHHVSAKIAAGQTVALVGPTGSGKSTIISLLARLYDPPPGTVFVDGVDVREIPLATLRGALGFVPQEPFLFSATLADNVAFGLDAISARPGTDRAGALAAMPGPSARQPRSGGVPSGGHEDPTRGISVSSRWEWGPSAGEESGAGRTGRAGDSSGEVDERMRRIEAAATVSRLDKDVADFPNGYDTIVGERGITLSGGQK
jgi:ATP-binding cassette subfamily B protein